MSGYLASAAQILITFAFGAVTALFVLRLLAELARVNFYNPICQFLFRATHVLVTPLRRFVPSVRRASLAPLLLAYVAAVLKMLLLMLVAGVLPHVPGLLLLAVADLLDFVLVLYMGIIFAAALMGMFAVEDQHPLVPFINQIAAPALRPLQRVVPLLGGLDFSPTIAILLILLARVLLVQPLFDFAQRLALGI
ncbi:MAG: YggT family protein [Metallibacterium sp.]